MDSKGILYLIPNKISEAPLEEVVPQRLVALVPTIKHYIVEDVRTVRRYLRQLNREVDINTTTFYELNKHTIETDITNYLEAAEHGENIGLISEAGLPCVADPGNVIVAMAHRKGIKVVPLVGPCSMMMALMASGLNGQCFAFTGYLPVKTPARREAISQLERTSARLGQSQIIIETPYRNDSLLADILECCKPSTRLCVAADITCPDESIRTHDIAAWRKAVASGFAIGRRPCVFVLLSSCLATPKPK